MRKLSQLREQAPFPEITPLNDVSGPSVYRLVTFPVPHAVTRAIGGESVGGQALGLGGSRGRVSAPSFFFFLDFPFFDVGHFKGLLNLLHITYFIFRFSAAKHVAS